MPTIPNIKPLDLILFKANPTHPLGIAMISVGQNVGHAGVIYSSVGENIVKILESVETLSYNEYNITNPNICIRRFKQNIDQTEAKKVIEEYYEEMKNKKENKYPYRDLIDSGLNVIMKVVSFGLWRKHNLLKDEPGMICSATYCAILNRYFKKEIFNEIKVISPQDLYESSLFETIKDFS